jgi:hypothetical protein
MTHDIPHARNDWREHIHVPRIAMARDTAHAPQREAPRADFMAVGFDCPPTALGSWLVREYGEKNK